MFAPSHVFDHSRSACKFSLISVVTSKGMDKIKERSIDGRLARGLGTLVHQRGEKSCLVSLSYLAWVEKANLEGLNYTASSSSLVPPALLKTRCLIHCHLLQRVARTTRQRPLMNEIKERLLCRIQLGRFLCPFICYKE